MHIIDDYESTRLGDDWGFYIDFENEISNNTPNNEDKIRKKYNFQKYVDICDEKYDYHIDNKDYSSKDYDLATNFIIRITSTTLITTAAITYFIFFVL